MVDNALFVHQGGNVGIGTTDPGAPVHIQTNTSETNDSVTGLMITSLSTGTTTTNFGGAIQFQAERNNGVNQNTGLISCQADVNAGTNISSGLRFSTGTAGVLDEKMRLTYDGKVGIGTGSPSTSLEISRTSTDQTTGIILENLQAGGYGSGIIWESKRSDNSAVSDAGRIHVSGANSWNSNASRT